MSTTEPTPQPTTDPRAGYVDLDGVPTWVERSGPQDGTPVVLLHGGMLDSRTFATNLARLREQHPVVTADRRGHGRTPDAPGPISYDLMARDTVTLLETVCRTPVHLVGFSDGAVVALLVALRRPDLVHDLVLVSGVFAREGWLVAPDPDAPTDVPQVLVDAYAEVSPDGRDHFGVVAAKLAQMSSEDLGVTPADLSRLTCRTLVVSADDDIVPLEHTLELYRSLPDGDLAVVPHTSHALLTERPDLLLQLVREFLAGPPAPTTIPVRRA
ncbi:alpha/beta fold hydrolase [Kineococcus sp. SYSU DK003]|uniref:alpha/beta fold hydrolase n=1 Tax=Kineococcus sp. SYSU DK003 TaxID=3383124 RepID=UPI003D7CEE7D